MAIATAFQSNTFQQTGFQIGIGGIISVVAYVAGRDYNSLVADREFNARVADREYDSSTEVTK